MDGTGKGVKVMKRLFLLAILTLSVVLVAAFPGSSAQAASGSIGSVCINGSTVSGTVMVTGSAGEQIGVIIGSNPPVIIGTIFASGQTYVFSFGATLPSYQVGQTITIQAGTINGNSIGAGLTGSGNGHAPGTCTSGSGGPPSIGYGQGGGSGVPANFVIRGINCTVAVFNTPDGTPVGSNTLLKGQNWFVNPVPIRGKFRRLWTEVYVSGPIDGFIPTRCVLRYAFP